MNPKGNLWIFFEMALKVLTSLPTTTNCSSAFKSSWNEQGDSFEPDSLENKMTALDRQMKEKGYTCSVVRDRKEFSSSKQVLDGKAKQLPSIAGQGKRPNKARQVIFFMYLI